MLHAYSLFAEHGNPPGVGITCPTYVYLQPRLGKQKKKNSYLAQKMDADEVTLPPGAPPKPAAQAELDDGYAMKLAEYWYSAYGKQCAMSLKPQPAGVAVHDSHLASLFSFFLLLQLFFFERLTRESAVVVARSLFDSPTWFYRCLILRSGHDRCIDQECTQRCGHGCHVDRQQRMVCR